MTNKRNIDRERLEVYLLHLLLSFRPMLQLGGLILLIASLVAFGPSPLLGCIVLGLALFLLLPTFSYQMTLYLARLGAWVGTLWR